MTDPTPAVPAVPAAPAGEVAPAAANPPKGKGLGIFALILGLLAFIGDIVLIIIGIAGAISVFQSLSGGAFDLSTILLGFGGFLLIAFIGLIVGLIVSVLAILLGLVAAVKNRGRVQGIFGTIFGFLVLITHGGFLATIAGSGDLISQIGGLGS